VNHSRVPVLAAPPRRIVSLVPSITEALFALGLGSRVVGVTEWCIHPAGDVAGLPKLGGTKNPDVEGIARLAPDLVIANHEENTRRSVEQLEAAGLAVWVTYPRTVREGAQLLSDLADLAGLAPDAAARRDVVLPALAVVDEAEQAAKNAASLRPRVFCPIWKDPWMVVGADTYAHDMLRLCGADNPFAEPGDRRYPIVEIADIEAARPDVVLLPDEPYRFTQNDADEIARLDLPAARTGRIHLIDGTWVSWYGPRIPPAVHGIRRLLSDSPKAID
jgi:ABC-type Fe3+-hydroxamate transport system substrate-binding protein